MASPRPSQAVVPRHKIDDVALMPPPPSKRIKRPPKVLDEDEYTAALSDIIARDYFPGLLESQAQHEYLAALDSGNDAWIAEAAHKLREAGTSSASAVKRRSARNTRFDGSATATPQRGVDTPLGPTGTDTPLTVTEAMREQDNPADTATGRQLEMSTLSLGAFQANYTSEDNESFNTVLDKQNQKRREKHAHLWSHDQRLLSARLIAHRAREARLLQQQQDDEAAGKVLVPMTHGATDSRPAKPDSWTIQRPDNSFMFHVSSVDEDGVPTVQEIKEQTSKAAPKRVVHANTRFPPVQFVDDPGPVPPSPSLNSDIIAQREAARKTRPGTEQGTEYEGGETPRVNGYAFVDEDEADGLAHSSESAATPSYRDLLAGQVGDGSPNPFKIGDLRKRETLHLRMLEKQARRQRDKDRDVLPSVDGAATPAGSMTPAARRLMEKLGGRTPGRAGGGGTADAGFDAKDMWTPGRTPRRKRAA